MRTLTFTLLASLTLLFSSCMKHAEDYVPVYGEVLNTWTFYDGSKNYFGNFLVTPVLNTTVQANNTYTLDMTGIERSTGQALTMAISLADLNFSVKSYQSGIGGSDHSTGFFYAGSAASRDGIYASTNNDPGAVMNYTISSYDAVKNTVTITFNGEAFNTSGKLVKISKGRMTANIEWK